MQLLRQSPQRRPRNRGHWLLKMMLDISPVLGEKSAFSQPHYSHRFTSSFVFIMGHPFRDVCLCHAATDHDPQQADKLCVFSSIPASLRIPLFVYCSK